jgi:hypothetical protein
MSSCSVEARKSNFIKSHLHSKRNQKSRKKETIFKIILNGKLVFPFSSPYCAWNIYHPTFTIHTLNVRELD